LREALRHSGFAPAYLMAQRHPNLRPFDGPRVRGFAPAQIAVFRAVQTARCVRLQEADHWGRSGPPKPTPLGNSSRTVIAAIKTLRFSGQNWARLCILLPRAFSGWVSKVIVACFPAVESTRNQVPKSRLWALFQDRLFLPSGPFVFQPATRHGFASLFRKRLPAGFGR
jgi:hypothetical protein